MPSNIAAVVRELLYEKLAGELERVEAAHDKALERVQELLEIANGLRGFIAPYNLSDEGPDSPFDQYRRLRERLDALNAKD